MYNEELKTTYGSVRNINRKKIKKNKLIKNGILGIAGAVIVLVGGLNIHNEIEKKKINDIPEDQVMTTISIQIEEGDTLSGIADRFYTDDCEGVYRYTSNYQDAIKKQNGLYSSNIKKGFTLEIPVIVEKNNAYYQHILDLQKQIEDIEQNNLWVKYTVEYGDSISYLAQFASGDISETYELVNKIANKNNIGTKEILREGQGIWIVNPELGDLKKELNEAQEAFVDYLSGNQKKNNY